MHRAIASTLIRSGVVNQFGKLLPPEPVSSNVKFLVNAAGESNGTTSITNQGTVGGSISGVGGADVQNGRMQFDGTNDYFSMSGDEPGANIGGSDFCIELFDVVNDSPD